MGWLTGGWSVGWLVWVVLVRLVDWWVVSQSVGWAELNYLNE